MKAVRMNTSKLVESANIYTLSEGGICLTLVYLFAVPSTLMTLAVGSILSFAQSSLTLTRLQDNDS